MARVLLEYAGGSIALAEGETVVGRSLECGVRFNDDTVSREHARFSIEGGVAMVEDLGSLNGTFINRRRVASRHALSDGDLVHIGERWVRVTFVDAASRGGEREETTRKRLVRRELADAPEPAAPGSHRTCRSCGKKMPPAAKKCPSCGQPRRPGVLDRQTRFVSAAEGERRRSQRFTTTIPVFYSSKSLAFEATAHDLSSDGSFVTAEVFDRPGTRCKITMLADGAPAFDVQGIVRRLVDEAGPDQPRGMGIEFTGLSGEAERWLTAIIKKLSKTQK